MHSLSVHEPVLVNLLGHSAGALVFGIFLVLLIRDKASRLSMAAAGLAFLWNFGSLLVLAGADSDWMMALSTSALSMLPAVLLHVSLKPLADARVSAGRWTRWLVAAGYSLSTVAVVLHCSEPLFDDPELHRRVLFLTAAGYAVLTLIAGIRLRTSRLVATMSLLLLSLTFVHFHSAGAHAAWQLELVVHHASIPLALFVLLQDYRFVLLDAFVRFLANMLLAGVFTYGAAQVARLAGWLPQDFGDPRRQALALILVCTLLVLYSIVRSGCQRLLTRRLFRRGNAEQALLAGAARFSDADEYVHWASNQIAEAVQAKPMPTTEGAAAIVPLGDGRVLSLGRREGGRRYLSEDLRALDRWSAIVAEQAKRFREAELRQLVTQAELKSLQSQIHPHFLFNALNTLYGTIPKEAAGARRMVLNLADIFRYFLRTDRSLIPLEDELQIIRAYLEIESLRLGPKLKTEIDVDESAKRVSIPALSVEPLVENAVKHGVAALPGGGLVRITARKSGSEVEVAVFDSGRGFGSGENGGEGVGLENVRRRLELCYGTTAALETLSGEQGTTVRFRVPA